MNIVITGTSRGIGLALARCALADGHQVLAVARDPHSRALAELGQGQGGSLRIVAADMLQSTAATTVAASLRDWHSVDVLVNNAGVLREGTQRADFMDSFAINSVAPFELTQALLPKLRAAAAPKAVHITSKMGSVAENTAGGHYAYRASKSALNMINRSLSRDHGWLTSVVVHPGWVQTDMGGAGAPVRIEESARGIWRLIGGLKRADSGGFFDYQGQSLPW